MTDYVNIARQGDRSVVGMTQLQVDHHNMLIARARSAGRCVPPDVELEQLPVTEGLTFTLSTPKTIRRVR